MRSATRRFRLLAVAAVLVTAASLCTAAGVTLDVPFVSQGEDLCGGAAAAMVLRYWGAQGVHAEAFAPLVDRSAGGIRTGALVADLRGRGWTAVDAVGDLTALGREVDRGRPVIALLEVRQRRYHYVVVIGVTADSVVVHDPARGPSRVMKTADFDAAWAKSDRWMLILLPGNPTAAPDLDFQSPAVDQESRSAPAVAAGRTVPAGRRCDVSGAIARATDGDYATARHVLEDATAACPGDAAPWRELAGVDALEAKWSAAAAHARRAVAIDPHDAHAWRILATAEYLQRHDVAALDAWNRIGEPSVDLVDVEGLRATRYAVIEQAMGVAPGDTLTPETLRLAEQRARDVPAIALAHLTFHPVEDGRAQVDAAVVERDRAPAAYPAWLGIGLNAAANREVALSFANPTGGGDLVSASWRWWSHRPMIAAAYSAPAPRGLGGGTWAVEASRETQTFSPGLLQETRTRAAFDLSRWVTARIRIGGAAGVESWSGLGRTPAVSGRIEFWPVMDRLQVDAEGTRWLDRLNASTSAFGTAQAAVRWRSSTAREGMVWLADTGYQFASSSAPPSVWPGADTGHARDVLLRAHPLIEDGVIAASAQDRTPGVFGRRLAFATGELQRWQTAGKWPLRIAPAAFVDIARAADGFGGTRVATQVDTGAGVRVSMLGFGTIRVDVARGLRDGRMAASVDFVK